MLLRLVAMLFVLVWSGRAWAAPNPKTYLIQTADVAQPSPAQPNPAQPNPAQPNPARPVALSQWADYADALLNGDDYYMIPCARPPPGGHAVC